MPRSEPDEPPARRKQLPRAKCKLITTGAHGILPHDPSDASSFFLLLVFSSSLRYPRIPHFFFVLPSLVRTALLHKVIFFTLLLKLFTWFRSYFPYDRGIVHREVAQDVKCNFKSRYTGDEIQRYLRNHIIPSLFGRNAFSETQPHNISCVCLLILRFIFLSFLLPSPLPPTLSRRRGSSSLCLSFFLPSPSLSIFLSVSVPPPSLSLSLAWRPQKRPYQTAPALINARY